MRLFAREICPFTKFTAYKKDIQKVINLLLLLYVYAQSYRIIDSNSKCLHNYLR